MKVLHVNAVYRIGSTGRNIYEMGVAMKQQGIESYVAATHLKEEKSDCFQIGSPLDWKIHGLKSRITGLQGYFSKNSTQKLISLIDDLKPDIVHLNNVHANYLNLPILFNYLSVNDIATVITLHDCWFYTGKCTHYTCIQCRKWETGCKNCPQLKKDNKSWFLDQTTKMWTDKKKWYESIPRLGVIGVSKWITNEARKSILKSATIIDCIYNWIDLEIFQPQKYAKKEIDGKLKDKFIILGVASGWSEKKGLNVFLELSKYLKNDEIILLVGKLEGYDIPENVVHIDATEEVKELVQYYNIANVFLQLSKEESFGKVVAESLACGTPVITVDSTANQELVPKGCGYVLPERSIKLICNAIAEIKKNTKEFYSNNCRIFAEKMFDSKKNINQYIAFYNKLFSKTQ